MPQRHVCKKVALMQGSLELVDIASLGQISSDEILRLTASAESATRHPLADSVSSAAKQRGLQVPASADAITEPGAGVCATINGQKVSLTELQTCI